MLETKLINNFKTELLGINQKLKILKKTATIRNLAFSLQQILVIIFAVMVRASPEYSLK